MKPKRKRLVEKGGVPMFEVRIAQWFDTDGRPWHTADVVIPEGHDYPPVHEAWGAMHVGFELVADFLKVDEEEA